MTIDERLDRLTAVVESLAASVVSHDRQIEALITVAEKNSRDIEATRKLQEETWRQFQAYLNTIHPKQ